MFGGFRLLFGKRFSLFSFPSLHHLDLPSHCCFTARFTSSSLLQPLGVVRKEEPPAGQELSRFNIPLAVPRRGVAPMRQDSRAISVDVGSDVDESTDEGATLMDPEDVLPYDDERFAEKILEMEVDGALDELWQDARKAHIEDVKEISNVLRDLKVRDVCAIDVSQKTSSFDYMIVGTCEGPRHIHIAAWAVQEADKLKRVSKVQRKKTDLLWEVVPVGRIVVNLMQESYRKQVNIERKWVVTKSMDPLQAANAPISEGRQVKAHGLWTLTLNLQDLEDFEVDYCKDVLMSQT